MFVQTFSQYPLSAIFTALGIGLMIGVVRERQHLQNTAGIRTHVLTALATVLAALIGVWPLAIVLALVSVLIALSYWRSSRHDPGLTGEIALMLTALLAVLAATQTALAAGLGALSAGLLYAKKPLHRFTKEILSEREVHDGMVLLASALIILPLLPDHPLDAYGVLNPAKLWRLVVLVMLVGALAHTALRLIGNRWGLPLAGFFAGYVSSTAATLNFSQTARGTPALTGSALAAALLANAASVSLFVPILWAVSPVLLHALLPELAVAFVSLLVLSVFGMRSSAATPPDSAMAQKRMFRIREALALVAVIAGILFFSAWMNRVLGPGWAVALALLSAAAELHAALIGLAQLVQSGAMPLPVSHWGLLGLLAVSAATKTGIAWVAGGRGFAYRFGSAMGVMLAAVALTAVFSGQAALH